MAFEHRESRLAGYSYLIQKFGLRTLPNWHASRISLTASLKLEAKGVQEETLFPSSYWPGDGVGDHLEFALKYDGLNPGILRALFESVSEDEITEWVRSKPTGKYTRKIWFLYEFLMDKKLSLQDLSQGNYINLLEIENYYNTSPGRRVKRQRVINNLLGGRAFCPIVRRTRQLSAMEKGDLQKQCEDVIKAYPQRLLHRALNYLYHKETKSSFEIERIKPSAARTARFVGLLEMAGHSDFCNKQALIEVQNRIVDPRFKDTDYRISQNYVGQSISFQKQLVHYVCPKPEEVPELMDGLISSHLMMKSCEVPAVVHAAAISYGFVFIHPFEDGNGRIHRFLIHNILSIRNLVPQGLVFPVSAAMLKNSAEYDGSFEMFSRPLMRLVEFDLDEFGDLTVTNEVSNLYRYPDMTAQAEALYGFVKLTVENELVEELDFLHRYDKAKSAIQEVVDLPDRLIDLFIRFCVQNNGRVSEKKRKTYLGFLTDNELTLMEDAFQREYFR